MMVNTFHLNPNNIVKKHSHYTKRLSLQKLLCPVETELLQIVHELDAVADESAEGGTIPEAPFIYDRSDTPQPGQGRHRKRTRQEELSADKARRTARNLQRREIHYKKSERVQG